MVEGKDFLGENYGEFKKEAEKLIKKYENGEYKKSDMDKEYIEAYEFFKFLKEFYKMEYIEKLISYFESGELTFQNTKYIKDTIENLAVTYYKTLRDDKSNFNQFFELHFTKGANKSIEADQQPH